MKNLLLLEDLGEFFLSLLLFYQMDLAWWLYPLCFLLPDLSMAGYAVNTRTGAVIYNIFHHKLLAIGIIILGYFSGNIYISFAGIILFGHAAFDRVLGYGLKLADSFHHTDLGWIGKRQETVGKKI